MIDLKAAAKQALEALEGVLDKREGEKVLQMSISGGLYEVVQVRDAIKSLQHALATPYSDIVSDGEMDPRYAYEQAAKARVIRPKGKSRVPFIKPLADEDVERIIKGNVNITDQNLRGAVYMAMRELEEAHGIKDYSDAHGPDWTERDGEYLK